MRYVLRNVVLAGCPMCQALINQSHREHRIFACINYRITHTRPSRSPQAPNSRILWLLYRPSGEYDIRLSIRHPNRYDTNIIVQSCSISCCYCLLCVLHDCVWDQLSTAFTYLSWRSLIYRSEKYRYGSYGSYSQLGQWVISEYVSNRNDRAHIVVFINLFAIPVALEHVSLAAWLVKRV